MAIREQSVILPQEQPESPADKPPTPTPMYFANEQDVDDTVSSILQALEPTVEGFRTASQMYNTDFFEGEDPRFVNRLANSLSVFFADSVAGGMKNNLWIKLGR